jgi:hypothetical protein
MTQLMNKGSGGAEMELTFTLSNGTRAGIMLTQELQDLTIEQLALECLAPAKDVAIVFYVPNKQALDRVRTRFGLTEC